MEAVAEREGVRWSLDEAFAYCARLARSHYENFPVGSRLAPRRIRPHVHAVYAFARIADDFADEPLHEGRRLERIDAWERSLDLGLAGDADHPVFVALAETIRRFDLPHRLLRDLLEAFRQDCRVRRYDRWDDLLAYCRLSANPIGRLVLYLHGIRDEQMHRLSDAVCSGLQLANFWQDVAVDLLRKDRIYLPAEDRARHHVREEDLREGRVHEGFRDLLRGLVVRTRGCFERGRPLLARVRGGLGLELRVVWLGGMRILDKIERAGYDVIRNRPVLNASDRARLLGRALLWRMR